MHVLLKVFFQTLVSANTLKRGFGLTLLAHQAFVTSVKGAIAAGEVTFDTLTANSLLLLCAEVLNVFTYTMQQAKTGKQPNHYSCDNLA